MSDYKSAHADNDDYLDEKEGDSRMISMARDDDYDESEDSDYKTHLRPRKVRQGMGLDLSRAPAKGDEEDSGKGIQETNVLVVFDLPDGSQGESFFKLGEESRIFSKSNVASVQCTAMLYYANTLCGVTDTHLCNSNLCSFYTY